MNFVNGENLKSSLFGRSILDDQLDAHLVEPDEFGHYSSWINARQIRTSYGLYNRRELTDIERESARVYEDLRSALIGVCGKTLEMNPDRIIFPYRGIDQLEEYRDDYGEESVLANNPVLNRFHKGYIHKRPIGFGEEYCNSFEVSSGRSTKRVNILRGFYCENEQEYRTAVERFNQDGIPFMIKKIDGTDGSGIKIYEEGDNFEEPVVLEEMADLICTASIQYAGGELGFLMENDKDEKRRWKGNSTDFLPVKIIKQHSITPEEIEQLVLEMRESAEGFIIYLGQHPDFGVEPVICGFDFAIFRDGEGSLRSAIIDPNIRMPGNMVLYHDKLMLQTAGNITGDYQVGQARIDLLYDEEAFNGDAMDLQRILDENGIGLITYNRDGIADGIRIDSNGSAEGIITVVQDNGKSNGGEALSMINIFGRNAERLGELRGRFLEIVGQQITNA